jgi:hypothetical protein
LLPPAPVLENGVAPASLILREEAGGLTKVM